MSKGVHLIQSQLEPFDDIAHGSTQRIAHTLKHTRMAISHQLSDSKRCLLERIEADRSVALSQQQRRDGRNSGQPGGASGSPERAPSEEQDIGQLQVFLSEILNRPLTASFIRSDVLFWKYFASRSDWAAPRSWVFRGRSRDILAHVGIWPVSFDLGKERIQSMMNIDWAASPQTPGLGSVLRREIVEQCPVLFGIGGTQKTRFILSEEGYSKAGALDSFVRFVNPIKVLRQASLRDRSKIKNIFRQQLATWRMDFEIHDWAALSLSSFESLRSVLANRNKFAWTNCTRTPELMNYMLACPLDCRGFNLLYKGRTMGYVLMNRTGDAANVVDLWVESEDVSMWSQACALAVRIAEEFPAIKVIWFQCSLDTIRHAAIKNRFVHKESRPIWINDPNGLLCSAPPLNVGAMESDRWLL